MTKKEKLQDLKERLNKLVRDRRIQVKGGSVVLNDAIEELLNEEPKVNPLPKALKEIDSQLAALKKDGRVDKLVGIIRKAQKQNEGRFDKLTSSFEERLTSLLDELDARETRTTNTTKVSLDGVFERIAEEANAFQEGLQLNLEEAKAIRAEIEGFPQEITKIYSLISQVEEMASREPEKDPSGEEAKVAVEALERRLETLRKEIMGRLGNLGGGNMNRSIIVGGNKDTLNKYTDINLKAGSGVTITYAANSATGYTDITIAATGGGGGIVREVNTVSGAVAAGNTAGIDYVYVFTGAGTLTLPDASGNTNLYTVKNASNGTVTIDTTGGDTIDADSSIVMPVQYTSVDLIANTSSTWNVT